jgi:hypothetical protein
MTTAAQIAFGTTIARAGNTIAELKSIGLPELTLETVDVTNHQSASGAREFVGTLINGGDVAISGNFIKGDSNGQIGLKADLLAKTVQAFVITFPDATTTWTFSALVTKFKVDDATIEGEIPFSATFKVTGLPTLGITASTGLTATFFAISESAVITPAPANATYTYVATVLTAITSVTVTPIATAGVITVNGNVVATGVASSAIALGAAGSVTVITIVVTETNKSPKTYTIYLSRATA